MYKFKLICEFCSYKSILDNLENLIENKHSARNSVEIKDNTILNKEIKTNPQFKCPQCGRTVFLRPIK